MDGSLSKLKTINFEKVSKKSNINLGDELTSNGLLFL